MKPRTSTTTNLNPHAREYKPIPPGVTYALHTPPPFFPNQPPYTACRPPPSYPPLHPPLLQHQILPSLQSTTHSTQVYYDTTKPTYYYVYPKNQAPTAPPPPPPPHKGNLGRGSTQRRRGYGRGRESVQTITNFNSERRRNISDSSCVRLSKHHQNSRRETKEDNVNKHKIMPLQRDEENTTIMIKNIPYDCSRKELINVLDDFCLLENQKTNEGTAEEEVVVYAYDFLYLPIDFRTKKSRGFAFVNFTTYKAAWKFFDSFHLKNWERIRWSKKIEIVRANIQGKQELVKHFGNSFFDCGTDEFLPACFSPARDGSGQPVKVTAVGNRIPAGSRVWRCNH